MPQYCTTPFGKTWKPSLANEDSLANAPDPRGEFFRVPKVIE